MTANVCCTARDEVRATRLLDELTQAGFPIGEVSALVPEQAVAGGFGPIPPGAGKEQARAQCRPGSICEQLYQIGDVEVGRCGELGLCLGAGALASVLRRNAEFGESDSVCDLTQSGVPRADFYLSSVAQGKILLSIHCYGLDETARLETVLTRAGAEDVLISGATSSSEPGPDYCDYRHAA